MKPIVKTLLRRFLLTLSGIFVWAKALAGGEQASGGQERLIKRQRGSTATAPCTLTRVVAQVRGRIARFFVNITRVHNNRAALLLTDLER